MDDNRKGFLTNPLPIVMVVLLAAGVLVNNEALRSARPSDPERAKFEATSEQDVEARLWQDPIAAVEAQIEADAARAARRGAAEAVQVGDKHNAERVRDRIKNVLLGGKGKRVIVLAVSVPGGSYAQDAETRRRWRFAVVSALGFQGYLPEQGSALGYFPLKAKPWGSALGYFYLEPLDPLILVVPYEWFKPDQSPSGSNVLVLWVNDDKISANPQGYLKNLFSALAVDSNHLEKLFIGPASSEMLGRIIERRMDCKTEFCSQAAAYCNYFRVLSPIATASNTNLLGSEGSVADGILDHLWIVRTTGTDDRLATALLAELQQRGVNHSTYIGAKVAQRWKDIKAKITEWWNYIKYKVGEKQETTQEKSEECKDDMVIVREWDTKYSAKLANHLKEGFCPSTPRREFTYLRGLDGALPDLDKQGDSGPRKEDNDKAKDLRAQLEDAPPEHAEGRNQFDYLRRIADAIEQIDDDPMRVKEGIKIKAIGIVGTDVYDKLLILSALRPRFSDKIFFTTDLDARYLHADQKKWTRNLVVASNFDLALRPELQGSTPPFRDTYQTATYLATLMALQPTLDDGQCTPEKWSEQWREQISRWLRPQLFEIGRKKAVALPTPSSADGAAPKDCSSGNWTKYSSIEPERLWLPSFAKFRAVPVVLLLAAGICLILLLWLTSRHISTAIRVIVGDAWIYTGIPVALVFVGVIVYLAYTEFATELEQGYGEPFLWFEGVSVWPSLVLRFAGLITTIALALFFRYRSDQQATEIADAFGFGRLMAPRRLNRSKWQAVEIGPHLDLASFNADAKVDPDSPDGPNVETLWQNYLRATGCREMVWWIFAAVVLAVVIGITIIRFDRPFFPSRGDLVVYFHFGLLILSVPVLWWTVFWVGYQTRVCAGFIEILSQRNMRFEWPVTCKEDVREDVPRACRDAYLAFRLIVRLTRRIQAFIYLPFILILFMVVSRSSLFDAMDFPLPLIIVVALSLAYAIFSAVLLRKTAEGARTSLLKQIEDLLPSSARPGARRVNPERIKLVMERIRSTREGAFAPFSAQPALQALLLPFGGYGGIQLIEYLLGNVSI